ncbi:MAG TPA: D-arabinono-1,4-lactone oxidase [Hyphomonadaceae bacterium]|nr:D-arabinono-1,4-lactone oxidase [Hyphomonadaceae bacterium]HPN04242.1 D-arabinono-1,4-lactone oxidase [Hyphomonadaceae bacterium]
MSTWSNWSGSVAASPAQIARPKTEAELARLVREAKKVRVVGAGHSFMPLCETDGMLISMSDMEGEITISDDKLHASAPAGTSLAKLTDILWKQGASLINQGDVNPQALAGAIATGTHGTGATLGSLSTAARGFELMTHDGSIVKCSPTENPDLFQASRLSLGLTGVATRIAFDILPAYHLEERLEVYPLDEVAARWDELAVQNRHVEFFVFPYADLAMLKILHPKPSEGEMREQRDMDDIAFRRVCDICKTFPFMTPYLQKRLLPEKMKRRRVGPAYRIFPSDRTVKFEEMEYELPRANGWSALREVIAWIRKKGLPVAFPFEFRLVAADDIWLSPFNGRTGASISMHQYHRMKWHAIFAEAEKIFRAHDGRPHWAKRHTLTTADLHQLYPQAAQFCAVRDEIDPQAKFANAHLAKLFDIKAAS